VPKMLASIAKMVPPICFWLDESVLVIQLILFAHDFTFYYINSSNSKEKYIINDSHETITVSS